MKLRTALFIFIFLTVHLRSQTPLVFPGSVWQYYSGAPLPATWTTFGYDDLWWQTDTAELGYGDGDETTLITSGVGPSNYLTYYFRKTVSIPNPALYPGGYVVSVKRDDGIVFYLNGIEVYRNNISNVVPGYYNVATNDCADDGSSFLNFYVPANLMQAGNNLLSAEVHQYESTGGDLSFDCAVNGITSTVPICIRGPYLQQGTSSGITIQWRTQLPCNGQVKFGNTYNVFTDSVFDPALTFNHEIQLSGLTPNTKYYYTIGSSTSTTRQDTALYFYTAQPIGNPYEIDIWITGDCGTGHSDQVATANAFANRVGNKYIDAWLLLGDNAYVNGFDMEYQNYFFDVYQNYRFLSQTTLWPAPGNHDYYTTNNLNSRATPYFNIFTVPTAGEVGGVPSGTESYYSYNIGNAHFISMDSYGTESGQKMYDTTSLQAQWLQQDLEANTLPWTIVYWHHPPYTMGSHNSDSETDLVAVRSKLLVILEQYKVDLVLCGHSHQYERSKLMKGHYGLEPTFDSLVHHVSSSSAKYDGTNNSCPYFKETADSVNKGIVYVVAGSAGHHTFVQGAWPHNAMYYSNTAESGSMYLRINDNRLDAEFISQNGIIQDQFTMMKNVNRSFQLLVPVSTPVNLTASWPGQYLWENSGDTSRTIVASFGNDSLLIVHDPQSCIADTFHITTFIIGIDEVENNPIKVYPNPTENNFYLDLPATQQQVKLELFNMQGQEVFEKNWYANDSHSFIEPGALPSGNYMIRLSMAHHIYYCKLMML